MRILGLMVVKNEEDILPKMLEYNSKWLDGIIAIDNGSTDKTLEILKASPIVLEVRSDYSPFSENYFVTQLLDMAYKYHADWYVDLDADEIYLHMEDIKKLDLQDYNVVSVDIYYILGWDSSRYYRAHRQWPRLYRNLGSQLLTDNIGVMHRGKTPISRDKRKVYHSSKTVLHYQCRTVKQTMDKYTRYCTNDKDLIWQPMGYEHLKKAAKALETGDYSLFEFKPMEVTI